MHRIFAPVDCGNYNVSFHMYSTYGSHDTPVVVLSNLTSARLTQRPINTEDKPRIPDAASGPNSKSGEVTG